MKPLCWESDGLFWQEALVEGGGESAGMPERRKGATERGGSCRKGRVEVEDEPHPTQR